MLITRIILFSLFLALLGCAAQPVALQRNSIDTITQKTSPEELEHILGNATVFSQFEISKAEKNYFVRQLNLQTGVTQDVITVSLPSGGSVPVVVDVPITTQYIVIQHLPGKEMFAWGPVEELSKDSNPEVSSCMPLIKQKIVELSKKK